ncbi:hypothetical protein EYZ11_000205 [Aspergillus tanneri]|uniref:Uncharacterized protein n=1 Tax=Aspergillus tanneri TaxID=1220188 RepID=A0A4S3JXN4_9EURO|nr:hypothetical protein EYZ11_000205 [Aspergillus tanneri]
MAPILSSETRRNDNLWVPGRKKLDQFLNYQETVYSSYGSQYQPIRNYPESGQ